MELALIAVPLCRPIVLSGHIMRWCTFDDKDVPALSLSLEVTTSSGVQVKRGSGRAAAWPACI